MLSRCLTVEDMTRFWDARPCNIRHSAAAVGSQEWSEEVTARKYFVESHIPRFAQFEKWKYKNVLEIGCGIGTDTLEFARAGANIRAIDASKNSIDVAYCRIVKLHNFFGAWIHCVDAEQWIPPGQYDLIYSFGVLHHTPKPEKVLRLAWKYLTKDGELRVMVYSRWCFKRMFGGQPEAQANCPLARSYTVKEAKELVESCGFVVEDIAKAHIFPWRIEDYIQHRYVKRWQYRWMPKALFSWLERHFGEHLLIVARKA